MSGIASGSLNCYVQFQSLQVTQDPVTGEQQKTWTNAFQTWASMNYQSVRDLISANAEQSEVRGFAVIRYRDNVDATMRIVFRGKYYQILGIQPDNDYGKEHLTVTFSEGVLLDQ